MTPQKTHILLVPTQGISVQTKVSHQRSYCFIRVGLRRTDPSQFIATYLKKGTPRSGLGSIELRYKPTKFKAYKAYNWKHGDLILRYTSLIIFPSRVVSSVIGGNENWLFLECWFAFAFVFKKCCGKQESPPSFILSNKERTKAQKIPFRDVSRVREVDYRKGRC